MGFEERGSLPQDSDQRDAREKIGVVKREQVYLFSETTGTCRRIRVRASIALFAIANASVDDNGNKYGRKRNRQNSKDDVVGSR